MNWLDPLTTEQRQRRNALREAKRLARANNKDPKTDEVIRLADYILRGEVPSQHAIEGE